MFLIHGRRSARIKNYTDNHQVCQSCKSFDLNIKVYRDYYHFFFIPVFPMGDKTARLRCNNCGEPMRVEALQKQYASNSKTPFYLFALPILVIGFIIAVIISSLNSEKEKAAFVENPRVGDVYTIRKDENNSTTYYFLRVASITGDTVAAYHNTLEYLGFISKLNDDDYFVKDEKQYFTKAELRQMLDSNEINSVDRNYSDREGFNRIK